MLRQTTPQSGLITFDEPIAGEIQTGTIIGNSGTGTATFQLRVNGANVFSNPDRPTLATGEKYVTKTGLSVDVDLADTITLDLISATGNGLYNSPTVILGVEDGVYEVLEYALSDETTTITTGTSKLTVRMPFAFRLAEVRSSLAAASSSGLVTVDINEGGASILSTKLSIDATEKTSTTAATPAVISDVNLANDAEITFDIDAAGSGAKGLKVKMLGTRIP